VSIKVIALQFTSPDDCEFSLSLFLLMSLLLVFFQVIHFSSATTTSAPVRVIEATADDWM
jgi:hypothetical protein